MRFRHTLVSGLVFFGLLSGCVIPKWQYKPGMKEGELGDLKPLHVAIQPMQEGRQSIPMSMGKVFLLYVPLVPYVTSEFQMTDKEQEDMLRQYNAPPAISMLEVTGRTIYDEANACGAFAKADYDPAFWDDYDVILKPKLTSTKQEMTMTSYGLGMAGVLFWLFPLPVGKLKAEVGYDLVAEEPGGRPIAQISGLAFRKWVAGLYYGMMPADIYPKMEEAGQEANRKAFGELVNKLREHFGSDMKTVENLRKRRYYEKLDPELVRFREALQGKDPAQSLSPDQKESLKKAYREKVEILEALRVIERDFTDKEQQTKTKAFDQKMEEIARLQTQHMQQQMQQAAMAAAAGAAAAGNMQNLNNMNNFQQAMSITQQTMNTMDQINQQQSAMQMQQQMANQQYSSLLKRHSAEFGAISGTRQDIRSQWLIRYQKISPNYDEVVTGMWPRPQYGAAPAFTASPASGAPSIPAAGVGTLEVTSEPAGADLYINGQFFGTTPSAPLNFPIGTEVDVKITRSGYGDYVRKMNLSTNNVLRINAVLEPAKN